MKTKTHLQKKSVQHSTAAPVENALISRGFTIQPQTENASSDPETAAQLGHNFGNISLIAPSTPLPIQPKLTIGQVGDKYEQEADKVAAQVVNQINSPQAEGVQRQEMGAEELQMKPLSPLLQRQETGAEEEELQMKPLGGTGGMAATPDLESSIQAARGGGQPLGENIRTAMEGAFGADFSSVRVHTDKNADLLNRSIQAKAFTTGQNVFFRQGEYQPGSRGGQELLAHELTHVVQQNTNTLSPKVQSYSLGEGVTVTPVVQADIQRAPLDYYQTKANYTSAYDYYYHIVEPWLNTVETIHPEAAGEVQDVRMDIEMGQYEITNWEHLELMILMVNAKIGAENPHFRGETEEVVDYRAGWQFEAGDLTLLSSGAKGNALSDLETLISECSGNIHSNSIGSVVGGIAVKGNCKKVAGLNNASARIDIQSPPRQGVFNVQYQVGGASVACVIFMPEDPQDIVMEKLLASFNNGQKCISPRMPT